MEKTTPTSKVGGEVPREKDLFFKRLLDMFSVPKQNQRKAKGKKYVEGKHPRARACLLCLFPPGGALAHNGKPEREKPLEKKKNSKGGFAS